MAESSTSEGAAGPSSSSAPSDKNATTSAMSTDELDKLLAREATAFQRDIEVERILKAFKLNAYDMFDIDYDATDAEIKKRYRHLSLFIHPDKTPHPRASEAFDLLKKAESELSTPDHRLELDAAILQARTGLLKTLALPIDTRDSDFRLRALDPSWKVQLRTKVKELLIDEEVRRRKAFKLNLANEGLEAKKKEEEVTARKRKAEQDANWEQNRDKRVEGWRSFQNGGKKKKKKVEVLG